MRKAQVVRWLGGGVAAVVVVGFVVWMWVIPAIIAGKVSALYGGKVTIGSWWLNGSSAGVSGLVLHEGVGGSSPVWLKVDRVETDLTLGGLFRGRVTPSVVTIRRPDARFLLDKTGKLATKIPLKSPGAQSTPLPAIKLVDARVTIRREGRIGAMTVTPIDGTAKQSGDAIDIHARANDKTWGDWTATGQFQAQAKSGSIVLTNPDFHADLTKLDSLPFVADGVGAHVQPLGTIGVKVVIAVDESSAAPVQPVTTLTMKGTRLALPTLGLVATGTTGRMTLNEGVLRLDDMRGDSLGGAIAANGTLDFRGATSHFDLVLGLQGIDVTDTPPKWELEKLGVTGRLSGDAHLKIALSPTLADLTGTTGAAVVENATLQGIPIKSLKLNLKAKGQELRYESPKPAAALRSWLPGLLISFQAPAKAEPKGPVFELPKSINTQIELEDVQLSRILDKSKTFGIPIILPIAGKLSLKADATIPLRKLSSLRQYGFHGQATLKEASILGVDLGRLDATLDLNDGVLELTDFRGRFVERPSGTYQEPPPASPPVPAEGDLPPGAFRGSLRAELSPKGKITAHVNGRELPLTELAAPFTPHPTPVSGRLDLDMQAEGAVDALQDSNAWIAQGQIHAQDVTARGATLTALKTRFSLADGDLKLPDLTANLNGKPLSLAGSIQLATPQAFRVKLDVADWSLADLEAFVPSIPRPPPADGALTANIEASGTLTPLVATIDGGGSIAAFQLGPVPFGTLPFRFQTIDETIHVTIDDARPFGGTIAAKASIPTHSGPRASGSLTLRGIDLARLSAAVPDDPWKLTGKASGTLEFSAATRKAPDVSPFDANLTLDAADLTVRGIEARNLRAVVTARRGVLHYDVFTESLGGTLKFQGDYPLKASPPSAEVSANLQAVGFSINDLARALGAKGMAAELSGTGALDANILARPPALDPRAAGRLEVRDLQLGEDFPVGNLKGVLHYGPEAWRLEPLNGRLLGGVATGRAWSDGGDDGANDVRFGMDLADASLADALAFIPFVANHVDGRGAFRLSGRLGTTLRVELQTQVNRASVFNLPLVELRAPGELTYNAASKTGTLVIRDATARYGGGQLRMSSRFQFGADPRYRVRLHVTKLDLEGLARASSDARRTASGRITGDIELEGRNPSDLTRMKGRVNLDLSDASIVELPIFRELGQFLGAARGGLFEQGNLSGQIAERQLLVEQLALQGRLVQIHATGSIGFDRRLDLDVLINTNQIIPETGMALARLIPGLNGSTRRDQALRQVSGFLSTRLTKVHVAGTLDSPQVNIDPAILVTEGAASFFVGVLELPLNLVR